MTMMVALGTLTPTSTTVVATSTESRPSANSAITASLAAGVILPWIKPTLGPMVSLSSTARVSAALRSMSSDSETSGQIQKAWAPPATASRRRCSTWPMRPMGTARVATGVRPGGFSSIRLTSRSP